MDLVARAGSCGHRGFDVARRAVHHGFHRENLDGHLRELFLHHSEFANLFMKGFALFAILRGSHEHVLRSAYARCSQREPPRIQNIERHDVPAPDFVQQVFFRHLAVFQENRRRRAAVNAHLVLFVPGLEARERALDDERREFLAVNLRKHDVHVGKSAVRNPHLLPVQNVVGSFSVQFRARQRILRVRSCLRFGKAVRTDPLPGS